MHFRTHVKPESAGISGQDEYADGMVEHDMHVGKFLDKLDELGIADNTIVFYSTDNGPAHEHLARCRDDAVPRREEHQLGGRLARSRGALARQDPGGSVSNEIMHHMDWLPDLRSPPPGDPTSRRSSSWGTRRSGGSYKVHLDGYNFLPYLTGQEQEGPRNEIFYFSDDGDLTALRYNDWKLIFMEQRMPRARVPASGANRSSRCACR